MKKFKYLLIAVMAMFMYSCSPDIEEVAEEVRADIKKELGADHVGEVSLVHKSGNEYTSVVDVTVDGVTYTYSLEVIFDGDSYKWELYE
jgi:hypothetical protein